MRRDGRPETPFFGPLRKDSSLRAPRHALPSGEKQRSQGRASLIQMGFFGILSLLFAKKPGRCSTRMLEGLDVQNQEIQIEDLETHRFGQTLSDSFSPHVTIIFRHGCLGGGGSTHLNSAQRAFFFLLSSFSHLFSFCHRKGGIKKQKRCLRSRFTPARVFEHWPIGLAKPHSLCSCCLCVELDLDCGVSRS